MTRPRPPAATTQTDPSSLVSPAPRRLALGGFGEERAARHLIEHGMVVLDRNWRCEAGEIDLVLRDGAVLVVCEVKTRASTAFGSPLEAVTETKAARLRLLAERWIEAHGLRPADVRIDLVGVLLPRRGAPEVVHVRGVC